MRESIGIDGRHYRIDPQDPTTLQVQPRYRAHWVRFATCPDAEHAAQWLAALGDLRAETQEEAISE